LYSLWRPLFTVVRHAGQILARRRRRRYSSSGPPSPPPFLLCVCGGAGLPPDLQSRPIFSLTCPSHLCLFSAGFGGAPAAGDPSSRAPTRFADAATRPVPN
jgi:hypothetical protein